MEYNVGNFCEMRNHGYRKIINKGINNDTRETVYKIEVQQGNNRGEFVVSEEFIDNFLARVLLDSRLRHGNKAIRGSTLYNPLTI